MEKQPPCLWVIHNPPPYYCAYLGQILILPTFPYNQIRAPMGPKTSKELVWLLSTILLTMLLLFALSWQSGWSIKPGHDLEIAVHDTFYSLSFNVLAMYVFSHVFGLVYFLRLLVERFGHMKLNLIMLVVYGYIAYANYMLLDVGMPTGTGFFKAALAGAVALGVVVLVGVMVKVWRK